MCGAASVEKGGVNTRRGCRADSRVGGGMRAPAYSRWGD
jgi:hypothetical protein